MVGNINNLKSAVYIWMWNLALRFIIRDEVKPTEPEIEKSLLAVSCREEKEIMVMLILKYLGMYIFVRVANQTNVYN